MSLIDPEEVLFSVIVLYRFLLLKESVRDIKVQIHVLSPVFARRHYNHVYSLWFIEIAGGLEDRIYISFLKDPLPISYSQSPEREKKT